MTMRRREDGGKGWRGGDSVPGARQRVGGVAEQADEGCHAIERRSAADDAGVDVPVDHPRVVEFREVDVPERHPDVVAYGPAVDHRSVGVVAVGTRVREDPGEFVAAALDPPRVHQVGHEPSSGAVGEER